MQETRWLATEILEEGTFTIRMQIAEGLQTHRKLPGPIQKEEEGGGLGEGMKVPDHLRLAFIRATLQAHSQA